MKKFLVHRLNALHVYCRLVDLGLRREWAAKAAARYEKLFVYRLLYAKTA